MNKLFIILIFISWTLSACFYDVEEELYPVSNCDTNSISFNNDILPIFIRSCFSCHNASAAPVFGNNIMLDTHAKILVYVNNNRLLGTVRHDAGFPAMPQSGAKLPSCDIAKMEKWVADGSPNN